MTSRRSFTSPQGFTLVELLTVIVILGIIAAISLPNINESVAGPNIARAGTLVESQLRLAAQHATARNIPVEVRFLKFKTTEKSSDSFRAVQLFEVLTDGRLKPFGKVHRLPLGIVILSASPYTSLFSDPATTGGPERPPIPIVGRHYSYKRVQFLPNAETNLRNKSGLYYLSIADERKHSPTNFVTLQIDPQTSRITSHRPEVN